MLYDNPFGTYDTKTICNVVHIYDRFDFFSLLYHFLVADERLYERLCPSVGLSVRWSVGPSVCRSVRWSVVIKFESVKTRIFAPAHPSATIIGRVSGLVLHLLGIVTSQMQLRPL